MNKRSQLRLLFILLILLGAGCGVLTKQQAIRDFLALRGYQPSSRITALAAADTMTPQAKHLLYVNRPQVVSGSAFDDHCPAGGEKTIVLGCYLSPDRGIYLYDVTDTRLDGVEQVTAAHEMLHAAYRRLSAGDRHMVDTMLTDYYRNDLKDQRVKATIDVYKQSEPNDLVNEMHSIFGTEVADLPAPLENYYKRYFTDRTKVTGFAANYQTEFTGRQNQVAAYDARLKTLKTAIDTGKVSLDNQRNQITAQEQSLQADRDLGDTAAYNQGVEAYNQAVADYNANQSALQSQINEYNQIVQSRNAVVLEERQLTRALTNTSENL